MADSIHNGDIIGLMLVGIGRIGKVHASNIASLPKVRLLYICDADKSAAQNYVDEYGLSAKPLGTDEIEIAYKDDRVHAVIVCCPTKMHEVHVKAALNHGKAVMCEKPLALSVEAISECYKLSEEKKKPLFCAFNRRFEPQISAVYSRIPEVVGKVKVVKTVSRDAELATIEYLKISGGVVIDSCIHDMDMVIWLTGQVPETVYALGHAHFDKVKEVGDVDQLFITIKFPDGAFGHIDLCRECKFGHDQRIEVFGSKGMLSSGNMRPQMYEAHMQSGSTVPPIYDSCFTRYNSAYRAEMEHFLEVVKGAKAPRVHGSEVIATTLCCYAANESLATGKPVNVHDFVKLKFPNFLQVLKPKNQNCH